MKLHCLRNARMLAVATAITLAAACGEDPDAAAGGKDSGATTDGQDNEGIVDPDTTGSDTADPDTGTPDVTDSADTDSGDTDGPGSDVEETSGETTDEPDTTGKPDCSVDKGADYCPCQQNSDCDQGKCIDAPGGKICAESCIDNCTNKDFTCKTIVFPGTADPVTICVPDIGYLCNPCKASTECTTLADGGAVCVDSGDAGAFCGQSCNSDDGCPVTHTCKDVNSLEGKASKQCVPKNNAICQCSPDAIDKGLSTVCFTGSGTSKCEGVRTCLAAGKPGAPAGGGLSACLAPDPKSEACNAVDDDCDGETDEQSCDDGNPCTADDCDGAKGCKVSNKSGACDADGSICTKDDACKDGKCVAGAAEVCDDNQPCTADSCDKVKGCVYANDDGKGCDADNTPCTENDACKDGKCEAGAAKACTTADGCVKAKCNLVDGKCLYPFQEGQDCNDANACTSKDKCVDEAVGCKGSKVECNDQNPCTADSCDPIKGCQHSNVPGACTDGNECTDQDSCDTGVCKGKAFDAEIKCDDKNQCTKDSCEKDQGCVNTKQPDQFKCEDGEGCTVGDLCTDGVCKAGQNTCICTTNSQCAPKEDGNLCNGTLYCDTSKLPYACKVDPKTVVTCDNSKDTFCASTQCVPATGACEVAKKPNGTVCDADQSLCSKDDQCTDGVCTPGTKLACDDKNPCTDDVCDPKEGCKFIGNTAPCDADGDACTIEDICIDKSCTPGKKKVCDDSELCTEDSCEKSSGNCKTKDLAQVCDDGSACTEGDKCGAKDGKWTCVAGVGPDCDDKNPCTKDSCDKTNGCTNTPDDSATVPCYSADPATKDKGICKEGTRKCLKGKIQDLCEGEVVPAKEEICGNSKDDTCNSQVDEGCKPTAYEARFGAAVVQGKVKVGNAEYDARMLVAGSVTAGDSKGDKHTASFGFYAWLKALLGK